MTGFLDRLLHADKPRPLDVDTAAAMLSTTPGLLREFERSYHANVLDRKNAPTGPLGPDAMTRRIEDWVIWANSPYLSRSG